MSTASSFGSDMVEEVTLVDVVRRLQTIEDIVLPMQPIPDNFATLEGTVWDQGHQQQALNLALKHIERHAQD
ncbi:hypothetical protein GUJ93_ZPchr0005g15615 [Zizania palustris]|uniref:Uncharacterized protein n=1 Tax=Zizania palustris TaxID=103762 RepID=A0A8J5VRB3_ZIZPA|nr:hypothetical protein GUJ93_ZPchr0005g15615 [Zizania palustris]